MTLISSCVNFNKTKPEDEDKYYQYKCKVRFVREKLQTMHQGVCNSPNFFYPKEACSWAGHSWTHLTKYSRRDILFLYHITYLQVSLEGPHNSGSFFGEGNDHNGRQESVEL